MKQHIKIRGSNYYLCGLKQSDHKSDKEADICMSCGYIAGGLLGMRKNVREFQEAVKKLVSRG